MIIEELSENKELSLADRKECKLVLKILQDPGKMIDMEKQMSGEAKHWMLLS